MAWPDLAPRPLAWAGNGQVSQAILFTRAVAFRNFAGFPFVVSAPPNACAAVADKALDLVSKQGGLEVSRLADLPLRAIRLLREREILPPRAVSFPGKKGFKYAAVAPDGASWILVNEVEHLAFGRIIPGLPSPDAFAEMEPSPVDGGDRARWARSPAYGFLTSDPARIGPGLSVEIIVHLPGLALSRQLPQARNYLAAAGAGFQTLAPLSGVAASGATGAADAGLFRLIGRGRLGKTAREAYTALLGTVEPLLRREQEARNTVLEKHHKRLEERMQQSHRLLSGKGPLGYADMLAAASILRLGAGLGMLNPQIAGILEELRVRAGSGHLAVSSGQELSQEEEDIVRSNVVRSYLDERSGEIH